MVTRPLVTHRELAHDGPPGELQDRAGEVLFPVNEEHLLLKADVGLELPLGEGITT